ncbi:2-amino-4-hydroxy-6-hydroxymethyldihydropteridine diphosphokinase [Williamsia limnetica]|uniref:2-amino-4-hydroxy-6-hydroxymethyldihydropteridine diphosphokinase n=1 Tax=Williamsia limnetica TaxID=882452 RepID=A0A318RMW3_WILLI|nr:2-amino-4-hydroxy-6-hydroxymethyldihydropteridine diphosphokinase [Williamsia limnetica]PYE19964.1 2-amino-4-hydroxy-6-hydroxymethyldihydropteridine diphosphokinase [Williamsia limnetica]
MTRAVLSIGSNIGDRLAHLQLVCERLGTAVVAASGVYSTPPWGGVEQEEFLNAVLIVDDDERDGRQWLAAGQELEREADRVRVQRWGPRTLDVDVISMPYDDTEVISDDPVLTLPHPRAAERAFVLVPWLEADPGAAVWHAGVRVPVVELLAALPASERDGVTRTDDRLVITGSGPR